MGAMSDLTAGISVTSETFTAGGPLPLSAAHSYAGGDDQSPQLSWTPGPDGTKSYAVTCYDPDAPTDIGFVHWVLFDIPATTTSLPAGAGGTPEGGAIEGYTDWGQSGWGGAAPPAGHGPHHYHFTVWALDVEQTGLDASATYAFFRFNTQPHVLGRGEIVGTYEVPAG
jgi:Raf kinase inhibitor-like YbhB/YbcL family protein